MLPNPPKVEDIPPAKIFKDKLQIQLGKDRFPLIMCYICPICDQPLLAYWKLNHRARVINKVVGRALRDSGFGAYRFFEEDIGQGFEYDPEKDPTKRHFHQKQSEYGWSDEITQSWMIFMQLNPIVTVNRLLQIMINRGELETFFEKDHRFLNDQALALNFINIMKTNKEYFIVIEDIVKHGKPVFYFEIVKWQNRVSSRWDEYVGIKQAVKIFGKPLLRQLNYGAKAIKIHEHYLAEEGE